MNAEMLIWSGGLFHVAFVVFHLSFWKLFRWKSELGKLTSLNRAAVQVLNLSLTVVFIVFAYMSVMHTSALLETGLGRTKTNHRKLAGVMQKSTDSNRPYGCRTDEKIDIRHNAF